MKEKTIDTNLTQESIKDEQLEHLKKLNGLLNSYGKLKDEYKPIVVAGILLALSEIKHSNFEIEDLTGDSESTDGEKIFNAVKSALQRANLPDNTQKEALINYFTKIVHFNVLNEVITDYKMTPLRMFTDFIYENLYNDIINTTTPEDHLGRIYTGFTTKVRADGQSLGIVLTPKFITELMCDLVDLKPDDVVLDPCVGTGAFLISALNHMTKNVKDEAEINKIKEKHLLGFEIQPNLFALATANMLLKGNGTSNIINGDFTKQSPEEIRLKAPTVGLMNPPYSQGSKRNKHLYELAFTEHLLDSLIEGGKGAVIVPMSAMTGRLKDEQDIKERLLKKHTLEGVITLNAGVFYGVGINTCIAVFTAHKPHPENKMVKFINFTDDGCTIFKGVGRLQTSITPIKKQHLLNVWFNKDEADHNFCVKTTIKSTDDWLHGYYYFEDEIPTDEDFNKIVADYLTFEFSLIMQGKDYLFSTIKQED